MEKKKEKWEYVIEAMPGTVDEIAARTGMTRIAVQSHIAALKKVGIVKPAYKIFCAANGRKAVVVYGHINAMPVSPVPPKPKAPPKPPRVLPPINTPHRTIWVGGNPFDRIQRAAP